MIFYFSGTGNSQLAAHRMAEQLGDEAVSINRYLKAGETGSFHAESPLVFVAPTYSWRLPRVVERWIGCAEFTGCTDAYFVLTCGGSTGHAAKYAQRLGKREGLEFRGLAEGVMPENYLALGPTPSAEECRAIIEAARPRIDRLAELVRAGEPFPDEPPTLVGRLESGPVNPLFYRFYVHDAGFTASDACTSCGKCVARCPLNNVRLADGKPTWNGTCTHCMACIGGCPVEAIEYKDVSKGMHRHYIMDDKLCWKEAEEAR